MKCQECGNEYDVAETQRVFGDADWTNTICSASCYTESVTGFKCECGNKEFVARQVCHVDIIVNGNNQFERNAVMDSHKPEQTIGDMEGSIYQAGTPYGPYTCTKCGTDYDEIRKV